MLRLQMLGGLSIDRAAATPAQEAPLASPDAPPIPLNGAAVQRRPLALLAFLATAGERGRSRGEVLLHLWPDSTPIRARNVLKQTLYALRRDLHAPDLVRSHGDRLSLDAAVLTSDVAEFEAALGRGEGERALALHRGPFLDGFSLPELPEFEQWVQGERERLSSCAEAARHIGVPTRTEPRTDIATRPAHAPPRSTRTRQLARGTLITLAALVSLGLLQAARLTRGTPPASTGTDPALIAVFPFDVASADSALGFMARGSVDLLAIKLTGDGGGSPRSVDPRVALAAYDRAALSRDAGSTSAATLQLAQQLGAGRALSGSVVGTPAHLVLTANVLAVPSGKALARASIAGTMDSLPMLIDRLAGMLLLGADVGDTGAESAIRTSLASTPLVAIRQYVDGQAAYRAGRYDDAVQHFDRALARDSTFAPAAFGLAKSAGWAGAPESTIQRGARLAWKYQDRLSPRAKVALVSAVGGPNALRTAYVADTALITSAERAASANPDDPEMWYWLADRYLHLGSAIGLDAPLERATAAFRRSIALDPTFAPSVVHLVQLAARSGDTAAVHRMSAQVLERDSTSESAQFIRWRAAVSLGDSAVVQKLRSRFDDLPLGVLRLILSTAEADAVALDDADRALASILRRSATTDERANALVHAHAYALDRGRRAEALQTTEALKDADPVPRWHLRIRVLDALYAGGDSVAARAAADTLAPFADAPLASDPRARSAQYDDISVVTQWQLRHGVRRGLARAVQRLTAGAPRPDSLRRVVANRIAVALLEAIATNAGTSRDLATVKALDSLLGANVFASAEWPGLYPALVAAQLFVMNGDGAAALTAVRRRMQYFPESTYLVPSLALEARLAVQLGDTGSATEIHRELRALRGPSFDGR